MKKPLLIFNICFAFAMPFVLYGEKKLELILSPAPESNTNKCLIYSPLVGEVQEGQDLKVNSDEFEFLDDKKLILKGDVELDFPEGLLRAGLANLDRQNGMIEFNKGQIFLQDFYFIAEDGFFNKEDGELALSNGSAFMNERNLIFNFDDLNGYLDEKISLSGTSVTSCADMNQGWAIEAGSINLDTQSQRGMASDIKLKIMGRTVLALPKLPFATSSDRMTGFLEPSLSFSSDGVDVTIPYYKVISDSSDITIAPRMIAKRGEGIEINFRSLHGKNKNLRNFDLVYFNKDDEYEKEGFGDDSPRWAFNISDELRFQSTKFNLNWSKASDSLFLRDVPGDITSIGSQRIQNLSQNFAISRQFNKAYLRIEHQGYQALNPMLSNGYKKSPSIDLHYSDRVGRFIFNEFINVSSFKASTIHGYFGTQDMSGRYLKTIKDPAEGTRFYSDLSFLNYSHINGINIASSFGIKSIKYSLKDSSFDTTDVNVPNALIDMSSIFFKDTASGKDVLEPRIVIGYSSYVDQSSNPVFDSDEISMNNELFSNLRFSGMDRIGDQKFYTLSLKYKKIKMGMEKVSLSISKKYFLDDRKVWIRSMNSMSMGMSMADSLMSMSMNQGSMGMSMDKGPIVMMGKWMPKKGTMIMAYGGYIKENKKVPLGGFTLNHNFDKGSFGVAKRYRRMSGDFNYLMDYSEVYANINLSSKFKFIAKLKKDNEVDKNIESVVGFEYENCCFALRVTGSDKNLSRYSNKEIYYPYLDEAWDNIIEIENKGRVNFEFELKGFNSSSNKINRLLNNSLFNY